MFNYTENITRSTINAMLNTLNDALKRDNQLANELLAFLDEHHVKVPVLSPNELENLIPVSFKQRNTDQQMDKIKPMFEGLETTEYLL